MKGHMKFNYVVGHRALENGASRYHVTARLPVTPQLQLEGKLSMLMLSCVKWLISKDLQGLGIQGALRSHHGQWQDFYMHPDHSLRWLCTTAIS